MVENKPARATVAKPRSAVAKAKSKAETAARGKAAATEPAARPGGSSSATVRQRREDMRAHIERRAYEIWESEGRPAGREHAHWLQAESEIIRTRTRNVALGR